MKRVFSIIGIIAGISLVFVGIISMCAGFDLRNHYGADSSPGINGHDTTRVFTNHSLDEQNVDQNIATTANNTVIINKNLGILDNRMFWLFGIFAAFAGLITTCAFGVVLSSCPKKRTATNLSQKQV